MNENEFTLNGKTYVAVEDKILEMCENCAFWFHQKGSCGTRQSQGKLPPCFGLDREDGKDVHFVEKGAQK